MDRKAKIFRRKDDCVGTKRTVLERFQALPMPDIVTQQAYIKKGGVRKLSLRELTEQTLLQWVAPAGALVNSLGDIFYLHGRTGMYLEPQPGETGGYNILKMARDGLRPDLAVALNQAVRTRVTLRRQNLRVKTNGDFTLVNLTIRPVAVEAGTKHEERLYLVILEESEMAELLDSPPPLSIDSREPLEEYLPDLNIAVLRQELRAKEEYLQTANEELETSNEELKSSNEEMQSVNEELQSTNEELETSKEELQSVNEELATVNSEMQTKVADLSRANNDMNNLLAGTGIATVFVDHSLRILRFTPATTRIINLILGDLGRPVGHIVSNLVGYDSLVRDAQEVLDSLIPHEVEVQTVEGRWYTLRIQPYRTLENVIEGAVITFVDITEVKKTREALREANDQLRLAVVVRDAYDAIIAQDLQGQIIAWNPGAVRLYGWSEAEALAMNIGDLIPEWLREKALATINQLSQAKVLEPYLTQRIAKDGTALEVQLTSTALLSASGQIYAVATTERVKI
jgi:two-component system CheB/CheR fusion protein